MKVFRGGFGVFAVSLALVAAGAASANGGGGARPVPLTGEALLASELGEPGTSTVTGTCNPLGNSTFQFRVTGVAFGPYPGTFVEEGTFTFGPFGVPGVGFAPVSFDATFTITSPAGSVQGSKTLTGVTSTGFGACGEATFGGTADADAVDFQGSVKYTANITTPGGSATDSGDSFVNYADSKLRGVAGFNGFNFDESFTSTSFKPGKGGGDDDDGDDDGGSDG